MVATKKGKERNCQVKKSPIEKSNRLTAWITISFIILVTYIVFSPSLKNKFTNWDDTVYVLENPLVVNNKVDIKEIFKIPVSANYHPITMLSLAWNYQKGKLDPTGYHTENVIFHLFNTCLVFFFILMLTKRNLLMASIVALFFGIHPMHVESVSWISERKDVLYVFFFLLGLITYLRYCELKKTRWYIVTIFLFMLSCLSKGMAVVFPVILLLIDYLLEVKWERKIWMEKIPFFILSLIFGVVAFKIQRDVAIADAHFFTVFQRTMFASYGAIMYVVKFFAPVNLSAYYPYPVLGKNADIPFFFYISPFVLLGVILSVYFFLRKERALVFGLLFYFVSVVLVLQFISVGTVIMADRYSYLSYIGLLYPAAYYTNKIGLQKEGALASLKYPVMIAVSIMAIAFSYETYARTQIWKNSETLWTDVISKSDGSADADKAYVNRGRYYHSINENNKALQDYNSALSLNPAYALAYNNRANIYKEQGFFDSALVDYNKAILLDPGSYLSYANRALILWNKNENEGAMSDFTKSISLNPQYWANYYNRGLYYFGMKEDENAIADFTRGIKLNFAYVDLYYKRGMAYYRVHKYGEAINDFSKAIELNPKISEYWIYRSLSETALGKTEEAKSDMLTGRQLLEMK